MLLLSPWIVAWLAPHARRRGIAKARVSVAHREVRVARPAGDPTTECIATGEIDRLELVALDGETTGWALVALRVGGGRVVLLETGDRVAGLRVRAMRA